MLSLFLTAQAAPSLDVSARHWFNNPAFRLHDDRDVYLFFFDVKDKEAARVVPLLNRIHRRRSSIVIGLTDAKAKAAQAFIRKHHVAFTVGSESRSNRVFRIEHRPALLHLTGEARDDVSEVALDDLNAFVVESSPPFVDVSTLKTVPELREYLESDRSGIFRRAAVRRLRERMPREEFLEYARQRLEVDGDPWTRNILEFYLSDPTPEDIARLNERAPSTELEMQFAKNPDAPEYAAARAFIDRLNRKLPPAQDLIDDFERNQSDDAESTLIRLWISRKLRAAESDDAEQVKESLMAMISGEPDRGIRSGLVTRLLRAGVCEVGDLEVVQFLDQQARVEPDRAYAKPMMEYTANYLRTGVGTPQDMQPPSNPDEDDNP